MKFKMKKSYWIILIIVIVAFLVWVLTRSAFSDTCSAKLSFCMLPGKTQSFFPRMWTNIVCTVKNLGCLIGQLF
ncbi:MAG: hypothetical protein J6Y03_01645 [Alphaproteobacteria bacterium]|nr:hypothetical protein [Alphaproteobacteria bacterium]